MHTQEALADGVRTRLRDTAREDGAVAALTALHRSAGPDALVHGPAGHVVAPAVLVAGATRTGRPGALAPRRGEGERDLTTPLLAALGLAALRVPPGSRVHSADRDTGWDADRDTDWDTAVVWLRLGLTRRLVDSVLAHLAARTFGDTPLLRQPVVKTELAAVGVSLLEAESALTAGPAPDASAVRQLHEVLTAADRSLVRLLGAWGLACDGPGATAFVSHVLADAYAPPALHPYEEAA
ncbi:hypothetical protein AB0F11_01680 [Streptomyces sp. NPDC032472]|uniref:hypothetical protein n=1 Tax=Streptomyces sp. NPDC032472 TaxID=3155018 RepID=UPI0033E63433